MAWSNAMSTRRFAIIFRLRHRVTRRLFTSTSGWVTMTFWQRLREDINSVFDRDPAARSVLEVITAYPGMHALVFHRVNHVLWNPG